MDNSHLNILIIDDNEDILDSFEIGLSCTNYNITLEVDPVIGLELYKKNNYNLVISDYKMPGMNGIKLLKRIKEYDPFAKVIIISGIGDHESVIEAINNHAIGFFIKPVNIVEIIDYLGLIEKEIRSEKSNEKYCELKIKKQELLKKYEALIEEKINLRNNLDIK